jgi:hypothetical protein
LRKQNYKLAEKCIKYSESLTFLLFSIFMLLIKNSLILRIIAVYLFYFNYYYYFFFIDFQCQITKLSNKRHTTGQLGDTRLLTQVQDYTVCEKQCSDEITCTGFSYKKADNNCFLLKEVALPVDDNCCDLYVKTCPTTTGYPGIYIDCYFLTKSLISLTSIYSYE